MHSNRSILSFATAELHGLQGIACHLQFKADPGIAFNFDLAPSEALARRKYRKGGAPEETETLHRSPVGRPSYPAEASQPAGTEFCIARSNAHREAYTGVSEAALWSLFHCESPSESIENIGKFLWEAPDAGGVPALAAAAATPSSCRSTAPMESNAMCGAGMLREGTCCGDDPTDCFHLNSSGCGQHFLACGA